MNSANQIYRGRFAPSPTGPLHAGSLVAALASWLDARAHDGVWLLRIEDVDTPRCSQAAADNILSQLAACGLISDEPVTWQSKRTDKYESALRSLLQSHACYACQCSRSAIARTLNSQGFSPERHQDMRYPGTCRYLNISLASGMSVRFRVPDKDVVWYDRWLGMQEQHVAGAVGDFVIKRSDGLWAYQLAVVVDDADQGITHVVRGQDLADNTPRQLFLQQALGLPMPVYMHTPLVLAHDGQKLSKQNGAQPLATDTPDKALQALLSAAEVLGLHVPAADNCASALAFWIQAWRDRMTSMLNHSATTAVPEAQAQWTHLSNAPP